MYDMIAIFYIFLLFPAKSSLSLSNFRCECVLGQRSTTNKIKRKLLILSHEFARFNFDFYLCVHRYTWQLMRFCCGSKRSVFVQCLICQIIEIHAYTIYGYATTWKCVDRGSVSIHAYSCGL